MTIGVKYKDWTFEEDKYILKSNESNKVIAKKLERSIQAIVRRKRMLQKSNITAEVLEFQENFIIGTYGYLSVEKMAEYLGGTYSAIRNRIFDLKSQEKLGFCNYKYSENEDEYLFKFKDVLTHKELAEELNCTIAKIVVRLDQLKKQEDINSKHKIDPMPREMKLVTPKDALTVEEIKKYSGLIAGKQYEVFVPRSGNEKLDSCFVGKFIEETDNHIIFQTKSGYRESFSKVNFKIKEYKIKEVSQ
ncbi:hypothetical protein CIW83_09425 [Tissierella sp. P1]|uniref:hypothetical protein n=1 Tax=Tissierella sp. P1 TaxID=1280483 RepID=UPI000BA1745A|nr:hypothetical protein [Tissierella sp. P1]OZV12309.1 hypothetical protein CIW83_09425 [Tissierella sp. P1]